MTLAMMFITGFVLLILITIFEGRFLKISLTKRLIADLFIAAAAITGWRVMFIIESGFTKFDGWSFFGSTFFTPPFMILAAIILKERKEDMLDLAAPCEGMILTVSKLHCLIEGCCGGKAMYMGLNQDGEIWTTFPSQLVECITALLMTILLLFMMKYGKRKGVLYAWYMVIYGILRFVLNLMRAESTPFVWILPAGNFWALISLIIGSLWLAVIHRKNPIKKPRAKTHKRYHRS